MAFVSSALNPEVIGTPCEVLRINKRFNGAQTTVDRIDPTTGMGTPFYILNNNDDKAIAVLHADPQRQMMSNQALGTAQLHTFSSKIDMTFRGMPFKMKGDQMGTGHDFDFHGRTFKWTLGSSASSGTIFLKDAGGMVLARWKKHPDGRFSSSGALPTFEVYVPPQSIDMDMLIVTGLASIQYWAKEKKDSIKAVGEIFGAAA